MKSSKEMQILSDAMELERKLYWKKHNEEINQRHLELIEEALSSDLSIYFRNATIRLNLGAATIKHLESLGYTVDCGLGKCTIAW